MCAWYSERGFAGAALTFAIAACGGSASETLPIAGIWEMDTSLTRFLAAEPRRFETFSCSAAGDRVRCAIVSERNNGMIHETRFEAHVGGPRAPISGFSDVQEVQLSFADKAVLEAKFYNRDRLEYTWRAHRSAGGDTLILDRVDITEQGARLARTTYRRVRREMP